MLTRPHFSEHAAFGLRTIEDDIGLPAPRQSVRRVVRRAFGLVLSSPPPPTLRLSLSLSLSLFLFLPRPFVSSAGKQMAEPHAQERALCHARAQGRGKREHDLYTDIGAREFHRGFVSV